MSNDLSRQLAPTDLDFLAKAAEYLERPSFLMRAANLLGKPVEAIGQALPSPVRGAVEFVVSKTMHKALQAALFTLGKPASETSRDVDDLMDDAWRERLKHNVAAGFTGVLAGSFGLPALALELPVTTAIMLRDIASVAQSCGEDLADREVRLQCLAVFNLGGAGEVSALDSTYYASRLALVSVIREATEYVAKVTAEQLVRDLARGASPALVRLIAKIASRFNVVVNQKMVAQAVPAIGAVGGALVNVAFNDHFDRVARFHFGIRSLERKYGKDVVQVAYIGATGAQAGGTTAKRTAAAK